MNNIIHKFEAAGLGNAPYRFVQYDYSTIRDTACDFCGTKIMHIYWIDSADNARSKVGSECIKSVGDAGLMRVVAAQEKIVRRAKAAEKAKLVREELNTLLTDSKVRAVLTAKPHPFPYYNRLGKTFADYAEYFLKYAGDKGRADMVKTVKGAVLAAEQVVGA